MKAVSAIEGQEASLSIEEPPEEDEGFYSTQGPFSSSFGRKDADSGGHSTRDLSFGKKKANKSSSSIGGGVLEDTTNSGGASRKKVPQQHN